MTPDVERRVAWRMVQILENLLHDWRATAEAYSDPEDIADLLDHSDDEPEPIPLASL